MHREPPILNNVHKIKEEVTGYERDGETGLDYAEATLYEERQGRFT
jgi:hypothetical protein